MMRSSDGEMSDYVIVGAGSAGCVLAARLSEDPRTSVLLLESGPADGTSGTQVPSLQPTQFKTDRDWDLQSEPEPGRDGRRVYLPRGRVLGGSSSTNTMIYIRGNPLDYDEWADISGDPGWSWDAVLPYFTRSEDNANGADDFHGVGGPLRVADQRSGIGLSSTWVDAAVASGIEPTADFNGASQLGAGAYQLTQRDGVRESAATAFLHPNTDRENLTVRTGAHAHRVLFDGERATGVEYDVGGEVRRVRAAREVILSAGTYLSPQLLLRSGIGPRDSSPRSASTRWSTCRSGATCPTTTRRL